MTDTILTLLDAALAAAEPNVLGNRYAAIEVAGHKYSAATSHPASRHNGSNSWGRVDYRLDGKRIAKANLENQA